MAIDEFYKRVGGDLTIEDIKYIEKVLEEVPTAGYVDMIIDKMADIIQKYRIIGTLEECREAMETVRRHSSDGWIPCSERLPVVSEGTEDCCCPEFNVTIKDFDMATTLKCGSDGEWFDDNGYVYDVVAWRPIPEPYRPVKKFAGDDYRQHVMERFCKVE